MNLQEKRNRVNQLKMVLRTRMRKEDKHIRQELKILGVCARCKDPARPLVTETMCKDCKAWMDAYAKAKYQCKRARKEAARRGQPSSNKTK